MRKHEESSYLYLNWSVACARHGHAFVRRVNARSTRKMTRSAAAKSTASAPTAMAARPPLRFTKQVARLRGWCSEQ